MTRQLPLAFAVAGCVAIVTPTSVGAARSQPATATIAFDDAVERTQRLVAIDPDAGLDAVEQISQRVAMLPARDRLEATGKVYWLLAESHLRLNHLNAAKQNIDLGLKLLSGFPQSKITADLLMSRGGYNVATTQVAAALADYQAAHNIFAKNGENRSQAIALLNIATLYQEGRDYNSALKYSDQAEAIYQSDDILAVTILNNKGDTLYELQRYGEGAAAFRKALGVVRRLNSVPLTSLILRNMARTELRANDAAAADRALAESFRIDPSSHQGEPAAMYWAIAAQSALQHNDLDRAKELITRSFHGMNLSRTPVQYRTNHATAYDIFTRAGDTTNALAHLRAIKRLDDETGKLAASFNTALAGARFDYANQELRIAKLRAVDLRRRVGFEQARARTQRLIFFGSAVVSVGILLLLGFGLLTIRRSRNLVWAANVDLAATNGALEKALAAKTEFLATTSHEIRTPLNGILGMTQVMLASPSLDRDVRERIGVVHGAGITMRALVDDILDVAKMESGKLELEQVAFDPREALSEAMRIYRDQAEARGLRFVIDLADAPPAMIGDAGRLRQIAFNLVSNALKFTERGSVTLRAQVVNDRFRLSVTDTGIGIPPDKLEVIFESFRQADSGTTRRFGGTGLGLAICRNLAHAMGGSITVESSASGSVFTVDFPFVAPPPRPAVVRPCADDGAPCLVVVDPNPISRSMVRTMLSSRVAPVGLVNDVPAALTIVAAGGVETVIVDDRALDDVTTDAIRSLSGGGRVRVVALAAAGSDDPILAAFGLVIRKPIAGQALADALYPAVAIKPQEWLATDAA